VTESEKYWAGFNGEAPRDELLISKAVDSAIATRNFEIELYWKRATYFWTFIAAAFAGYFALLARSNPHGPDFPAFVVSCIGIFLNLSWFLVNKGSKFWQENWESHVGILSLHVTGPIFTKVMFPKRKWSLVGIVTNASPFSVSKINQWVSVFMLFIWMILMFRVAPFGKTVQSYQWIGFVVEHRFIAAFLGTLFFAVMMCLFSRTGLKTHECEVKSFVTKITN